MYLLHVIYKEWVIVLQHPPQQAEGTDINILVS